MTVCFFGLLFLSGGALLWSKLLCRAARLKQTAARLHGIFRQHKDELVTPVNAQKLEFFTQTNWRFTNVITCREPLAFTRMADCTAPKQSWQKQQAAVTVFTAERFDGGWPALKIMPKDGLFIPSRLKEVPVHHTQISAKYHILLSSPQAARLLSPAVQQLLLTHAYVYLEIYDNAFVYHEGRLLSPAQWEEMHLRANRFLTALAPQQTPIPAAFKMPIWADQPPDAQVQALLAAARPQGNAPSRPGNAFSAYKAVVLVLLLLLIPALLYFIVRHLPH